jgi:hypothetical protein
LAGASGPQSREFRKYHFCSAAKVKQTTGERGKKRGVGGKSVIFKVKKPFWKAICLFHKRLSARKSFFRFNGFE